MKPIPWMMIAASLALAACNTIEGMGRDIESAGEAVSGTAHKTKKKMAD